MITPESLRELYEYINDHCRGDCRKRMKSFIGEVKMLMDDYLQLKQEEKEMMDAVLEEQARLLCGIKPQ